LYPVTIFVCTLSRRVRLTAVVISSLYIVMLMSVTLPLHCIEHLPIYINNWIADLLFAKEPSSGAKPSTPL